MPEQYTAIKENLIHKGYSEKKAKTTAAKIFISKGKNKSERSSRAKQLHD